MYGKKLKDAKDAKNTVKKAVKKAVKKNPKTVLILTLFFFVLAAIILVVLPLSIGVPYVYGDPGLSFTQFPLPKVEVNRNESYSATIEVQNKFDKQPKNLEFSIDTSWLSITTSDDNITSISGTTPNEPGEDEVTVTATLGDYEISKSYTITIPREVDDIDAAFDTDSSLVSFSDTDLKFNMEYIDSTLQHSNDSYNAPKYIYTRTALVSDIESNDYCIEFERFIPVDENNNEILPGTSNITVGFITLPVDESNSYYYSYITSRGDISGADFRMQSSETGTGRILNIMYQGERIFVRDFGNGITSGQNFYYKVRYYIMNGGEVRVYGKENQGDDWVYMNDAADAPYYLDLSAEYHIGLWDTTSTGTHVNVGVKMVKLSRKE